MNIHIAMVIYDDEPERNKILGAFSSHEKLEEATKEWQHSGDGFGEMRVPLDELQPMYVDDYGATTTRNLPNVEDDK